MAIFKNLTTGICEEVLDAQVIELMENSDNYEEAPEAPNETKPKKAKAEAK